MYYIFQRIMFSIMKITRIGFRWKNHGTATLGTNGLELIFPLSELAELEQLMYRSRAKTYIHAVFPILSSEISSLTLFLVATPISLARISRILVRRGENADDIGSATISLSVPKKRNLSINSSNLIENKEIVPRTFLKHTNYLIDTVANSIELHKFQAKYLICPKISSIIASTPFLSSFVCFFNFHKSFHSCPL
ncbi:unnamed protein product [Orchesella dallaii]|uniref:Uncharacterized protein n=1 Tax=Orchesella dallaii TaxID=48710 RepID=A0ABP1QTI2_9HEXA